MKPQERRRHPRKPVQDRAVIHRKAQEAPHATLYCTTVDISASGLQLKLKQALERGERVELVVHVPGHQGSFRLQAVTRWTAPLGADKSYLMGVEIVGVEDPAYGDWQKLFI